MLSRRSLLGSGLLAAGAPVAIEPIHAQDCSREPTFSWSNIPEFMWGAPERTKLIEPGMLGERLALFGKVVDRRCTPIAGARVDFWHAGPDGKYDYAGFRFRGLQRTDAEGRFRLETLMPGYYSPRRHVHYLVGLKRDGHSGILLTNSVGLPTAAEIQSGNLTEVSPDIVEPRGLQRRGDGWVAMHDIVLDLGG